MNALLGGGKHGQSGSGHNSHGSSSNPLGSLANQFLGSGSHGSSGSSHGNGGKNSSAGKLVGQLASSFMSSSSNKPQQPQNYHGGQTGGHSGSHSQGGLAGAVMGGVTSMFGGKPGHESSVSDIRQDANTAMADKAPAGPELRLLKFRLERRLLRAGSNVSASRVVWWFCSSSRQRPIVPLTATESTSVPTHPTYEPPVPQPIELLQNF